MMAWWLGALSVLPKDISFDAQHSHYVTHMYLKFHLLEIQESSALYWPLWVPALICTHICAHTHIHTHIYHIHNHIFLEIEKTSKLK